MEEQIEELKNDITECYGCDPMYYGTDGAFLAENLVKKGWRKQEWISVDERLPQTDEKYLVYTSGGRIYTSYYYITNTYGFEFRDVSHWMPLPEDPKGGAE